MDLFLPSHCLIEHAGWSTVLGSCSQRTPLCFSLSVSLSPSLPLVSFSPSLSPSLCIYIYISLSLSLVANGYKCMRNHHSFISSFDGDFCSGQKSSWLFLQHMQMSCSEGIIIFLCICCAALHLAWFCVGAATDLLEGFLLPVMCRAYMASGRGPRERRGGRLICGSDVDDLSPGLHGPSRLCRRGRKAVHPTS